MEREASKNVPDRLIYSFVYVNAEGSDLEMEDCAESINRLCDLGYRLVRCNLISKSEDYILKFCKP